MAEVRAERFDAGALGSFDFSNIPIEASLYLGPDDGLEISIRNINSGIVLELVGRMASPLEGVKGIRRELRPTADRAVNTWQYKFGEGVLLSLALRVQDPGVYPGSIHAQVGIIQGFGAAAQGMGTLIQDWPSSTYTPAWRASQARQSVEGLGNVRRIIGSNPATGAEHSETVPTGALWELLAFWSRLTTSATAGNRYVTFILDDGTDVIHQVAPALTLSTVDSGDFHYAEDGGQAWGLSYSTGNYRLNAPLPVGLLLRPGYRFRTLTTSLAVGDEWDTCYYAVREWLLS